MNAPIDVFISNVPADENHRKVLEKHLRPLEREKRIRIWSREKLSAGEDRRAVIGSMIETAPHQNATVLRKCGYHRAAFYTQS
ncbi:hypothetical protein [Chondromyces apiculatus]|uniref:Uncharacterized protein n=1 Tax=Chondromyces apiculatus DSM 436 TaxID=1192034 RepID=A0A017STV4_9BACT|nr:hypothetical protein [Chondromyces apiculatus]EYF00020.1 Hypothetical protein CAP_1632 [Chondromyces apiculatus DSM 436]